MVQLLFNNNHRQNITNSSTNSYIRTGVSSPSSRNPPCSEEILQAWRISSTRATYARTYVGICTRICDILTMIKK